MHLRCASWIWTSISYADQEYLVRLKSPCRVSIWDTHPNDPSGMPTSKLDANVSQVSTQTDILDRQSQMDLISPTNISDINMHPFMY